MNNDEKIYELVTKMYGEMQKGFKQIDEQFENVEKRLDKVEKTVVRIENDHGHKLNALFDGYKLNSDKLDRIETEVSKH